MDAPNTTKLLQIYDLLLRHFGHQNWWPGDTAFEIIIGAVLTQNTNWSNVSRVIARLKEEDLLSFPALEALSLTSLAERLRPAGYYNLKAGRLKNLLTAIRASYAGDLTGLLAEEPRQLREWLLSIKGIGPETADSIILYAANQPIFVVDAYTHRIFSRHGMVAEEATYDEIQEFFTESLPSNAALFNEFHALLVALGKNYCKKKAPRCETCPMHGY